MSIFTISGVSFVLTMFNVKKEPYDFRDVKLMGFEKSLDDAINTIIKNDEALFEHIHEYLVVEEFKTGIFQKPVSKTWYRWDGKTKMFVPSPEPTPGDKFFDHPPKSYAIG